MNYEKHEKIIAVILAGGVGSRMGAEIPKQYLEMKGKPVLAYSLTAFQNSVVDEIFVVCDPVYEDMVRSEIVEKYGIGKFAGFAESGSERVWSVKNGIDKALKTDSGKKPGQEYSIYLMIHDGARPLVSPELIERCAEAVRKKGAVVPGLPLKDTIKEIYGDKVISTPERHSFVAVQTPQCFRSDIITDAYAGFLESSEGKDFSVNNKENRIVPTDDASLVEMFTDRQVTVVTGDERNLKITTPADMQIVQLYINE